MVMTRNGRHNTKEAAQSSPNTIPEARSTRGSGPGQRGLSQNDLIPKATIAEEVTKAIQEAIPAITEQIKEITRKVTEDRVVVQKLPFYKCSMPELHETGDPIAAMRWIRELENIFDAMKCADEDKVVYAVSVLRSEALYWWDMVKDTSEPTKMTWGQFKKLFEGMFCPARVVFQTERELARFEQGSQTVREYTTRFLELASVIVQTEEMKIDMYVRGLNYDIRIYILVSNRAGNRTKLHLVVEDALTMEALHSRQGEEMNDLKRKREESEGRSCTNCGKSHGGECRYGSKACYRCGELGHLARQCPSV
ncbi:zinc finger, CCHC-type, retrotransposon gag domain protein [Tanacetum coccineum]